MKAKKTVIALLSLLVLSPLAEAKMAVSAKEVRPGEWNSNFTKAKEIADTYGIPMVVFWASPGCGWCGMLEKACQTKAFLQWQSERKILLVFCRGTSGDNMNAKSFAQNASGAFPYVCIYWNHDGQTIKEKFTGRQGYMPIQTYEKLEDCFIASIEKYISGWDSGSGTGYAPSVTPQVVNAWTKTKFAATLPLYQRGQTPAIMRGTVDVAMTTSGKLSAKYRRIDSSRTVSISGKWSVNGEGVASLAGAKGDVALSCVLTQDGRLSIGVSDAAIASEMSTGEAEVSTAGFKDCVGLYTMVLPVLDSNAGDLASAGAAFATIKVTSSSTKGTAKCAITYPDGKTTSVSVILSKSGPFALMPVLKYQRADSIAVPAKIRRNAAAAVTPRAILAAADDVVACYNHVETAYSSSQMCGVYGSYIVRNADISAVTGLASFWLGCDLGAFGAASDYGTIQGVVGNGLELVCQGKKLSPAQRTTGFSISYKASTGAFKGSTKIQFANKSQSAKFGGVLLPGWGTGIADDAVPDCPELVQALGCVWFKDKIGRKSASRGFPLVLTGGN